MKRQHEEEIYRGYDIVGHPKGGFIIYKDNKLVGSQPSLDFCYAAIDRWLKEAAQ